MKKLAKNFFSVFIFLMAILCSGVFAYDPPVTPQPTTGKSIVSLNVSVSSNSLLVWGQAEEGTLAVAIAVYDKSGKKPVTMRTTGVDDNNNYGSIIELEDGKYIVKVADYEGGKYLTKQVTVGNVNDDDKKPEKDKKDKKDKQNQKDNKTEDEDSTSAQDIENSKKHTRTMYFPKTYDSGSYFLIMAGLGILTSLFILVLTDKKIIKAKK